MNGISTKPPPKAAAVLAAVQGILGPRRFRLVPALPRVGFGVTAAVAGLSAAIFVFGTFSDLSAMQLAAGPQSSAVGSDGKPIVLAHTGRSWAAEAERRAAVASAVPLARLARASTADVGFDSRATK